MLEHIALGQTNQQIADELYISTRTVAVHVSHILGKVGAATRSEAAAIAHRLGLAPAQAAASAPSTPPAGT